MKIKIKRFSDFWGTSRFTRLAERQRAMCEARRGGDAMEAMSGSTASSSSPEVGTKSAHWGFTIGGRKYRVPRDFQHPGGRELMDRHDGTDIGYLFRGTAEEGRSTRSSHVHSGAARRLLEKFAVVPMQTERGTREQGEEDRGGPCTLDAAGAGRVQVVNGVAVDLDRPLVLQVGALLDSYQVWVHKPELGKPRFFQSEVLEQLSKTKWWVVPFVWLPVSLWLALVSYRRLRRDPGHGAEGHLLLTDSAAMASCYLFGVLFWSVVEYAVHRFMFHVSTSSYWPNTLHFLFHGCHHKFPMDDMRLVMPPAGALPIVLLVYIVERYLLGFGAIFAPITLAGTLTGYVCYDMLHYHCHFSEFVKAYAFLRWVRRSHMDHHYRDNTSGFGISSPAWDLVLGTQRKEGKGARGTACK